MAQACESCAAGLREACVLVPGGIGCLDSDPNISMLSLWLSSSSPECLGPARRSSAGRVLRRRSCRSSTRTTSSTICRITREPGEATLGTEPSSRRGVRGASEAVLVSFWRRPELSLSSGTPTEWIAELADPVELWCRCHPDVPVDRSPCPGAPSTVGRLSSTAPLIVALDEILLRLDTVVPVETLPAVGARRATVRVIPLVV